MTNVKGDSVNATAKRTVSMAVLTVMGLAGCAAVEPWDRDVLARPEMQIVSDPTEAAADEHIYFSKEASSGGQGFGGGGCGCN
ncbi:MAG: DUF4266 domain-containing protein [Lysobacterales bacterium]|nr:MAG: DUF4266 domain-containing protein [Xanthomonadales bacterium]